MKRLLCFFDGTWNVPDGRSDVTNVVKLARVALGTAPDGIAQVSRYVAGIGTDPGDSDRQAFFEGAIGVGLDLRIVEGFRFLAERYEPGDEIYLFGFSRGAFQARSLASLIALTGLPGKADLSEIQACWNYYQRRISSPDSKALARLRDIAVPGVRIRCLGVWDTVGNLGIPLAREIGLDTDLSFHDLDLPPIVDVALHALAIDEPRGPFSPSLWTRPRGAPASKHQLIEQVWFPGSHANIGGGYPDSALSDVALHWMADRVMATTGAAFDLVQLAKTTSPDPLGLAVAPTSDIIYRVSRLLPFVRLIRQHKQGIGPWRRTILGTFRTNALPPGLETIGEDVHPSAAKRYGHRVKLKRGALLTRPVYRPRTLAAALGRRRLFLRRHR